MYLGSIFMLFIDSRQGRESGNIVNCLSNSNVPKCKLNRLCFGGINCSCIWKSCRENVLYAYCSSSDFILYKYQFQNVWILLSRIIFAWNNEICLNFFFIFRKVCIYFGYNDILGGILVERDEGFTMSKRKLES